MSAPSGFGTSTGPSGRTTKPAATAKRRKSAVLIPPSDLYLPLEGYSWGCTIHEEEVDIQHPKWWLTWRAGADRLVVCARTFGSESLQAETDHEFEPVLSSITVS